jgi:hypothetical protein
MTPKEVAKKGVKLLPALCNHLEAASGFFQVNMIKFVVGVDFNLNCKNLVNFKNSQYFLSYTVKLRSLELG